MLHTATSRAPLACPSLQPLFAYRHEPGGIGDSSSAGGSPPLPSSAAHGAPAASGSATRDLQRLANLALAAWGTGAVAAGQRVRHLLLRPAAGSAVLQLCFEAGSGGCGDAAGIARTSAGGAAGATLVVVALPQLAPGAEPTAAAAARLTAAARFVLGPCFTGAWLAATANTERLAAWLARAFARLERLCAGDPVAAALAMACGPPLAGSWRLRTEALRPLLRRLAAAAPQPLLRPGNAPGGGEQQPACCLFTG